MIKLPYRLEGNSHCVAVLEEGTYQLKVCCTVSDDGINQSWNNYPEQKDYRNFKYGSAVCVESCLLYYSKKLLEYKFSVHIAGDYEVLSKNIPRFDSVA